MRIPFKEVLEGLVRTVDAPGAVVGQTLETDARVFFGSPVQPLDAAVAFLLGFGRVRDEIELDRASALDGRRVVDELHSQRGLHVFVAFESHGRALAVDGPALVAVADP